jgi:hypothetical protein
LKITLPGKSRIEIQRSRAAALHLDPVSLRGELSTASLNCQDCKDSMDSAIDSQLPAVEQTDVNEPWVQLSKYVELAQIKRGRSASDIWTFFTAAADTHTRKSTM